MIVIATAIRNPFDTAMEDGLNKSEMITFSGYCLYPKELEFTLWSIFDPAAI